jgi:serine/threonine-protein kinase
MVMSVDNSRTLTETIGRTALLTAAQYTELSQKLQPRYQDPRALAKELLGRGWLTSYQLNQVFRGRTSELVLGPYVLLERLGEGGSGQVFKARHQHMNRIVALKLIRQ